MCLKDTVNLFYQLDNVNEQLLKEDSKFRRGAVGVNYGRPATLLDAANYAKEDWDNVTDEAIKNAFIKADLRIILDSAVNEILQQ